MRRHLAPEDKAHLVLRFIKSKESASALCRKHRISQSNYYRWRQIFVLAGTDALRRIPKCAIRAPARMPTKANEHRAKVNAEKIRLQRSIEAAVRSQSIDRRVRLTETTKRAIIDLVDTSSIPKITALTVARVARSTYYQWRKIMLMNVSPQENQYLLKVYQAYRSRMRQGCSLQVAPLAAIGPRLQSYNMEGRRLTERFGQSGLEAREARNQDDYQECRIPMAQG